MSAEDNELVNEWLSQLNELQPADGKLTSETVAAAGPFPVYKPPGDAYDYRDDDEKSYQLHRGMVARRYALEMAQFHAQMAGSKSERSTGDDATKHETNALYWSQIVSWLKTIQ